MKKIFHLSDYIKLVGFIFGVGCFYALTVFRLDANARDIRALQEQRASDDKDKTAILIKINEMSVKQNLMLEYFNIKPKEQK